MRATRGAGPSRIGPFQTVAELGQGAMGRVLLAVAPDGRLVVVKQVRPELAEDAGFRVRFRHEVAASRKVSGAYAAAILDADTEATAPWLASAFVPGPSLGQVLAAAGPMPEEAVRLLAEGLAQALVDVHRAGLVHGDLKPSNVLLTTDGGVRVIDFGIARAAEGHPKLTHAGAMVGSPPFMAPEQVQDLPRNGAADVFSLGSTLVMACTGKPPFAGTSVPGVLYNVAHRAPDLDAVPRALRSFIEVCLAKDPAQRPSPLELLTAIGTVTPASRPRPEAVYRLAAEQQAEIDQLVGGPVASSAPALAAPVRTPPTPHRKRTWWLAGATAAAVVATAAVLTFLSLNGDAGDPSSPLPHKPDAQEPGNSEAVPTPGTTLLSKVPDKYTQRVPTCKEATGKVEVPAGYGNPSGNLEAAGETPKLSNQCFWSNQTGDRIVISWDHHLSQGGKTGAELADERFESGYASAHGSYERTAVGVGEEAYWQRGIANLYARDVNMRLNVIVESRRYSPDEARNIALAAAKSAVKLAASGPLGA
ncbi:serine/threonine-protein kinase [Nonomuraea sp. NPDC050394]|uniref:serine/threonine-protein kinase n=1 Tax=Nonomuraea sp. NPDC050394 TaxID=3364363 RepID=UPI00379C1620